MEGIAAESVVCFILKDGEWEQKVRIHPPERCEAAMRNQEGSGATMTLKAA